MIGFDDALALLRASVRPLGSEHVPLEQAHGRILAAPVHARIDSPRADVSTMDGYAVRAADLGEGPVRLVVAGVAYPGAPFEGALGPGQCARIFTGAALPRGADQVVIQEVVSPDGEGVVFPPRPAETWRRVRASDFAAGEVLVPAGRRLDAQALVAIAGGDVGTVEVARRPRVVLLGTGDELVAPGEAATRPAAIPDSLSIALAARVDQWGGEVVGRHLLPDDLSVMEATAREALAMADLVIVTGGASVGERDHAKAMFAPAGLSLLFSKVAIKPGKPVWFGRAGSVPVIGLPGNPTSAMVTARLFVAPLLAGLTGAAEDLAWRRLPLAHAVADNGDRETFMRGLIEEGRVRPLSNQDSGSQGPLANASVLIRRAVGASALAPGDAVPVIDF